AFAHKGGMHAHAVERIASSYEHVHPETVGNSRRVLVSDMSGRSNVLAKAKELGFKLTTETPELKTILARVKELENEGFEFEAAEASLALLIQKQLERRELPFAVEGYHVSMRGNGASSICEGTIKVRVKEQFSHTVADRDGPVNAHDSALRQGLAKFFPQLTRLKRSDYKVRIIDGGTGTAAKTRVVIVTSDGKTEWGTV